MTHPHSRALEAAARALALKALASEMKARGYNDTHASEYADEWWPAHLDRARAAVTAYLAEAGDGWRDIETAPKDGTTILAASQYHDEAITVAWDAGRWRSRWDGMKVIESQGDWGTDYWLPSPLQFWRPLPAPPAAQDPRP